jgi:hypothetical protein
MRSGIHSEEITNDMQLYAFYDSCRFTRFPLQSGMSNVYLRN